MDYASTLEFLYSRLPMYSRIGAAAYKEDLDNTIALCGSLGDPHTKFRSIHIAGTNGKGSVSHMLASVLQEAGYRTGLYTSPHLRDFRERIRINGKMIPEEYVIAFTETVTPAIEKIEPSFFELTVAMAFTWFAQEKVDVAVIETGLGGRLDSTNILRPVLSVITNIGADHMNILGDSLEKIAAEKAGIIKEGTPVVIGETQEHSKDIFLETAKQKGSRIHFADEERKALDWFWLKNRLIVELARRSETDHRIYKIDLPGIYQLKNLVTVLEAVEELRRLGWKIEETQLHRGLEHTKINTGLHGRWECISQAPQVFLDVAHNTEGVRQLLQQIEVTDHGELHLVLGLSKDKDPEPILRHLPTHASYYFTQAHVPRALPAEELTANASKFGLNGKAYENVNQAVEAALLKAHPRDLIVVFGSIFLVGELQF